MDNNKPVWVAISQLNAGHELAVKMTTRDGDKTIYFPRKRTRLFQIKNGSKVFAEVPQWLADKEGLSFSDPAYGAYHEVHLPQEGTDRVFVSMLQIKEHNPGPPEVVEDEAVTEVPDTDELLAEAQAILAGDEDNEATQQENTMFDSDEEYPTIKEALAETAEEYVDRTVKGLKSGAIEQFNMAAINGLSSKLAEEHPGAAEFLQTDAGMALVMGGLSGLIYLGAASGRMPFGEDFVRDYCGETMEMVPRRLVNTYGDALQDMYFSGLSQLGELEGKLKVIDKMRNRNEVELEIPETAEDLKKEIEEEKAKATTSAKVNA
jgi:hypothetical protein